MIRAVKQGEGNDAAREEFENENTYVQVIDGEIMVLEHNGKYIINKL